MPENAEGPNQAAAGSFAEDADIARRVRRCMVSPMFLLLIVAGFLMNMVRQMKGYLPKYVY